ncbi:MAG: hypothetical protein IIZ93_00630 [Acidaminococcaceae bacterium]|nr:hypothetical protein [Acidaminococcaceae bacterium]
MSDKLKGHEIVRLLDNLIGPVEAYGDSAADEKVLQNLKTLIDVANWCIDGVNQSSGTRHRQEHSMRKIGETAFSCLCEWREWIDERIKEDNA